MVDNFVFPEHKTIIFFYEGAFSAATSQKVMLQLKQAIFDFDGEVMIISHCKNVKIQDIKLTIELAKFMHEHKRNIKSAITFGVGGFAKFAYKMLMSLIPDNQNYQLCEEPIYQFCLKRGIKLQDKYLSY